MRDMWKQWLRQTGPVLRRPRWDIGVVVALAIFCIFLLLNARSSGEHAVSAVVGIEFLRSDGELLSLRQYATNDFGREVIATEASLLCSELFLRKAQERLDGELKPSGSSPEPRARTEWSGKSNRPFPDWQFAAEGICLQASGKDATQMAKLLNETADVYREERNRLFPAPPGCKGIKATLVRKALPPGRFWILASLIPCALSACLLGLAVAVFRSRKLAGAHLDVASVFLAWLALLFGIAIRISSFDWVVALAGAILSASLIAGGVGCIALAEARKSAVPPTLLRVTFITACVICLGYGVLDTLTSPVWHWDSVRAKVEIVNPAGSQQLPAGYDHRFIEAECELIQSRAITGRVVEKSDLKSALSSSYGFSLNQREAEEIVNGRIAAKPVKGTSLIDIRYCDVQSGEAGSQAKQVAEVYRGYWRDRSQSNSATRVAVTVLDSGQSVETQNQIESAHDGWRLTNQLLSALFVLGGALCVAWLGRNPRLLWCLPLMLVAYLLVMGVASITSSLTPEVFTAACQVRIWPPMMGAPQFQTQNSSNSGVSLIERERGTAGSDEVLSRVVQAFDQNVVFKKGRGENWKDKKVQEKLAWLREHLNIIPVQRAYLLRFVASAGDRDLAAEIANLAATAFCESKAVPSESAGLVQENLMVEIMDRAVAHGRPESNSGPVLVGLAAGGGSIALITVGAVISYIGFLVQRIRQNRESPQTGEGFAAIGMPLQD